MNKIAVLIFIAILLIFGMVNNSCVDECLDAGNSQGVCYNVCRP